MLRIAKDPGNIVEDVMPGRSRGDAVVAVSHGPLHANRHKLYQMYQVYFDKLGVFIVQIMYNSYSSYSSYRSYHNVPLHVRPVCIPHRGVTSAMSVSMSPCVTSQTSDLKKLKVRPNHLKHISSICQTCRHFPPHS